MDTSAFVVTPANFSELAALVVHYGLSLAGAVVLLIGGWILSGFISRCLYRGASSIHGIDETLARFMENVLHYGLLVLVFVMVLGQFGVQTASIIAALGAAGLAIGLALQGTLQNIAAGIMLLILRPFRVGEYIETTTVNGKIVEIGLFATEMRTADGLFLLAPNSTLWNTPIVNHSREPRRRQQLTLTIATSDLNQTKHTLLETIGSDHRISDDPPPHVYSDDLSGEKTTLKIEYWAETAEWTATKRDMIDKIKSALVQRDIAFA